MSENNYGALMIRSALTSSDNINAILSPGVYTVPPGNNSSPDAAGGTLIVYPGNPATRSFISEYIFLATSTYLPASSTWGVWKFSLNRSSPFADIKGDGTGAIARSNLDLKSAALRDVGNGSNQIPDMSFFGMVMGHTGYQKLPSSMIIQWGTVSMDGNGNAYATLPNAFPAGIHGAIASEASPSGWTANSCVIIAPDVPISDKNKIVLRGRNIVSTNGPSTALAGVSARYLAWGY